MQTHIPTEDQTHFACCVQVTVQLHVTLIDSHAHTHDYAKYTHIPRYTEFVYTYMHIPPTADMDRHCIADMCTDMDIKSDICIYTDQACKHKYTCAHVHTHAHTQTQGPHFLRRLMGGASGLYNSVHIRELQQ